MSNYFSTITIAIPNSLVSRLKDHMNRFGFWYLVSILSFVSILTFIIFLESKLGLAYNDARSHLDIGRRVVEGLKPGLAQLGSVWLPLPHLLMVPTIWHDLMWHTGLSGALQSMISYVGTGVLIYLFLKRIGVGVFGRLIGVFVFAVNLNILYLQSTAMTELLLLFTMTAGVYMLMVWGIEEKLVDLVYASFWIMLSTLIRYDGWFLLFVATAVIALRLWKTRGFKEAEGTTFFFLTLSGFGIFLWFLWNLLIFKDPLYFAFGPYSAHSQQQQLLEAGVLDTKWNVFLSTKVYLYALIYNSGLVPLILGAVGAVILWFDKKIKTGIRIASLVLFAPLIFNILALFLGHSVLFVQGISGETWFNVRYGVMMMPSIAIFVGFLIDRAKNFRYVLTGILIFFALFSILNVDAVTIDDARVGSSQKNVSEVAGWLEKHAKNKEGFVLISAASHDAIIFSSTLPMSKFIHEGTGAYWESATASPDRWARWIVMRTNDTNDQTFRLVNKVPNIFEKYNKVGSYPFADIYELKAQYLKGLQTKPVFPNQK